MQVRVVQAPTRVHRDGSSASQQAAEARMQELQAEMSAAAARVQELIASGAPGTASGRAALAAERESMAGIATQMREQELLLREMRIEDATAAAIEQAFSGGRREAPAAIAGARPREQAVPDIPQGVQDVAMLFIICMAAALILTPLMRAFGRIIERRSAPPARIAPEIQSQLVRMEQAIDAIAVEVERVAEGQRFATRLLSEREKVGELRS